MTQLWDPYRHEHDYRSARHRQGRSFYGHALREVLEAPEPKPSRIYRITEWYMGSRWAPIALLILGAAFLGASIVFLVGCNTISGCQPGATRCKGEVVEKCYQLTGWERIEVCTGLETCHFNDGGACHTLDVACCR
jgi:hypothetical protein